MKRLCTKARAAPPCLGRRAVAQWPSAGDGNWDLECALLCCHLAGPCQALWGWGAALPFHVHSPSFKAAHGSLDRSQRRSWMIVSILQMSVQGRRSPTGGKRSPLRLPGSQTYLLDPSRNKRVRKETRRNIPYRLGWEDGSMNWNSTKQVPSGSSRCCRLFNS